MTEPHTPPHDQPAPPTDPGGVLDAPADLNAPGGSERRSRTPNPPTGRQRTVSHLLIAALCAGLGYAIIIQVQATDSGNSLAAARPRIWWPSSTA